MYYIGNMSKTSLERSYLFVDFVLLVPEEVNIIYLCVFTILESNVQTNKMKERDLTLHFILPVGCLLLVALLLLLAEAGGLLLL